MREFVNKYLTDIYKMFFGFDFVNYLKEIKSCVVEIGLKSHYYSNLN